VTRRIDCHRPGALIPAHYDCQLLYCLGFGDGECAENTVEAREMTRSAKAAGQSVYGSMGVCGVCGARYIHGAIYTHVPTGDLVHLGHDCAQKYEILHSFAEADEMRERYLDARAPVIAAAKLARDIATTLTANPGLAAALQLKHYITVNINARFAAEGKLSPAQIALVLRLADEATTRAANPTAARGNGIETHVAAPLGRVTFTGKIVSRKNHSSEWGDSIKITIKVATPDGVWLAWGTWGGPVSVGDTITLTATLHPGRETHFVFFKRPCAPKPPKAPKAPKRFHDK
jgi:hypothetical protein